MISDFKKYWGILVYFLKHKIVIRRMLAFSARWNLPWLAARILAQLPKRLPLGSGSRAGEQRRILAFNFGKDEFFRDLEQIFSGDETFEIFAWPHYALESIAQSLLHPSLKHDNYLTDDPEIEMTKERYRKFISSTWRHHQAIRPVDAVISANFGYLVQREVAAALEKQGTPFIVMQKENLNAATPERRQIWQSIYRHKRGRFGGRRILVYNDMERELEISSGVVDPNRVEVVGMPRLDRFHRWRREHAICERTKKSAHVLFFSFSPTDKLTRDIAAKRNWGAFCTHTHHAVLGFAKDHGEVEITIKTKGTDDHDDELQKLLSSAGDIPDNLKIVSGGDAFELITNSDVVIGFNTTGLIEALALGKPVIVPRFGEAIDPVLRRLAIDLGNAVEYAESPLQIQELISSHVNHSRAVPSDLNPNVEQILRYWVGNDDGYAGRRAYEAIRREVIGR